MSAPPFPLDLNAAMEACMNIKDPRAQADAVEAMRRLYGREIDILLDPPPIWRSDLVDGDGKPISAPPPFDEFVTSKAYMGQPGLYPRQREFFERGMSFDPGYLFSRRKTVHTLIALWGKGSGKDFICSLLLAYMCFVINAMEDPWTYFKHAPDEPIDIANIATTSDQARTVFFNKLKARIKRPCFKQFTPSMGVGLMSFFRTREGYSDPILLLQLHSLHAKAGSWEGKSLIGWIMDEADAFEDESGNSNADQCYLTLASSAGSRFGSRYLGLIISFRRIADGFMDRMREASEESPGQMIFDEGATWDIRPDKNRSDPEIEMHYKIDPLDAACKYENIAPPVVGGFFTMPERLDACCDYTRPPIAQISEWEARHVHKGTGATHKYIALALQNLQADSTKAYFMHGDPGHTDASFAISLCHIETNRAVGRGLDKDATDDYDGDILLDNQGNPMPGRRVIYFSASGREECRTQTDREGRHAVWLNPGVYGYAFYDRDGHLIRYEQNLRVDVGAEISIESASAELDTDTGLRVEKRMVFPVVEDLLMEWKPREGMPVDYDNVEKVIIEICNAIPVQQVSFDKFNSAQLVQNLNTAGVNAIDMSFSNPLQMAMFRNLRTMVNAGLYSMLGGAPETVPGRALRQLKRLKNKGNIKVEPPADEWKDLADARAASVYFACILAEGFATEGEQMNVWSPGMGQANGLKALVDAQRASAAFGGFRANF